MWDEIANVEAMQEEVSARVIQLCLQHNTIEISDISYSSLYTFFLDTTYMLHNECTPKLDLQCHHNLKRYFIKFYVLD
jgi:hypothetical protein